MEWNQVSIPILAWEYYMPNQTMNKNNNFKKCNFIKPAQQMVCVEGNQQNGLPIV